MCNFWKIFKGLAVNLVLGFSCNFENSLKIIEKSEKCKSYFFGFILPFLERMYRVFCVYFE
jgi:hypothetical protein